MSGPPGGIPPTIAQLTGPVLLGHLFNWGLFGALTVQTYIYYLSFPKDKLLPKALVCAVFVIEILQTILATRDAFRNFGTGWGNMEDLNDVGWLWFSVPVMSSIISCTAQMFYAWRIYILSQKLYLSIIIGAISIVQAGAGIWCGAAAHILGVFSEVQSHEYKPTSVWLGGTALCDVIIATAMLYYLSNSRTGFRQTSLLLTRIIRITVETGFVCAAFAILDLAFFLRFQNNNYHLAPSIALSKLYSNSLLVVLNARMRVIGGRALHSAPSDDYSLSYIAHNSVTMIPFTPKASQISGQETSRSLSIAVSHQVSTDAIKNGNDKDNDAYFDDQRTSRV
ncbi:hypothetical protein B0H34DRAFT_736504 [Crassisporium funariophilum]|nr:hypothetical protein B0H34DRAFT_736504 [Crassisporium funariophilum]